MHHRDPEKQTVNLLANEVDQRLGCQTDDQYLAAVAAQVTGGGIELYSDMGPCHSCRAVLRLFLHHFPLVNCTVTYRKTNGRGRPVAALTPAGGRLCGAYGYEDAPEVNGLWCTVLARRRRARRPDR